MAFKISELGVDEMFFSLYKRTNWISSRGRPKVLSYSQFVVNDVLIVSGKTAKKGLEGIAL
jgi:hypothetical protein